MARKRNKTGERKQKNNSSESQRQAKIELQLDVDYSKYDNCNELALSSEKNVKKKSDNKAGKSSVKSSTLSKKKQKKLKKILERKTKIKDRKLLIEELKKYAISAEENSKLISVNEQQSKKSKRSFEDREVSNLEDNSQREKQPFKVRKGEETATVSREKDLNIVGFEEESDEESVNDSPDTENESKECTDFFDKGKDRKNQKCYETQDKIESSVEIESFNKNIKENKTVESSSCVTTEDKLPKIEDSKIGNNLTEFVPVHRLEEVEKARLLLPILSEEQVIMETIRYNQIVIICGETGSGKTTQIPQFLYEAGYAKSLKICITEPRRVAAISMSKRVACEMNVKDNLVAYQIRFDGNIRDETKICFVTDGVLMKEIQKDFLLSSYSVIVIDEAHERSLYSDILIGLLSRIIPLRLKRGSPLRLIIMSATLRVEDFTGNPQLFKVEPKVLKIQSRQYSVTIHFSKRTPEDYVQEAYLKVCAIHRKYPEGGILVFVTGQQEVLELCSKLRRTFPFVKNSIVYDKESSNTIDVDNSTLKKKKIKHKNKVLNDLLPEISLDDYKDISDEEEETIITEKTSNDINEAENTKGTFQSLYCLPLYAKLPEQSQSLIFEKPPDGSRLCVIATNIAETSLTIPGIKYVVDTGKVKTKVYDKITGISTMIVTWTSKASADQRAGRAGRVSNGHCFRLYSSAIFNEKFMQFSPPEISNKPVDELLLQMKSMNIENVFNFPFPTPPSAEALRSSEKRLLHLGALKEKSTISKNASQSNTSKITELGKAMSFFPLNPRYSKMLVLSVNQGLLVHTIAIVACLTVQDIFLNCSLNENSDEQSEVTERHKKWRSLRKKWADTGNSLLLGDFMVLLKAVGASHFVKCSPKLIEEYGLRLKAMIEIRKLRLQLTAIISKIVENTSLSMELDMNPPTEIQTKCLRQLSLAGLLDHVAKKLCVEDLPDDHRKSVKHAYKSIETDNIVYLPHESALYTVEPEYVVYQEIYESSGKLYMRNVVAIEKEWLPTYAPGLCKFSKPLESPQPRYDSFTDRMVCSVTATFGPHSWIVPTAEIEFPESIEKYRWFAKCLLEGEVCDVFLKYKNYLASSPSIMVKSWAKLQPRTQSILSALYTKKCASKKRFLQIINEDSNFLLNEFCEWLPEQYSQQVRQLWSNSFIEQP